MLQLKTKSFFAILFCTALLTSPAASSWAQNNSTGQGSAAGTGATQQTKAQIPAALIAKWQREADAGNADAQFLLGNAYFTGNGIPQDYNQAVSLWHKAADQGNASAQKALDQLVPK